MASNNGGAGATQVKSGDHAKAISRGAGYDATVSAMNSKTRSQYPHVDKHYRWESAEIGDGSMIAERGLQNP